MGNIIIIMGVSGCGKTTIGKKLASKLKIPFCDGDDFHPESNISKMKNNIELDDQDRKPWLETLAMLIKEWSSTSGAILACSSLKESYRQILSKYTEQIEWIFLSGSFETIKNRVEQREEHFMNSTLLQSQFDTLEIPKYALQINIENEIDEVINEIISKLEITHAQL